MGRMSAAYNLRISSGGGAGPILSTLALREPDFTIKPRHRKHLRVTLNASDELNPLPDRNSEPPQAQSRKTLQLESEDGKGTIGI